MENSTYFPSWTETIAQPFVYNPFIHRRFHELYEDLSIHLNSLEIRSRLTESNVFDLGDSDSYFRERIKKINEMNRIGMIASGAAFSGTAYPLLNEDDLCEAHKILQQTLEQFK